MWRLERMIVPTKYNVIQLDFAVMYFHNVQLHATVWEEIKKDTGVFAFITLWGYIAFKNGPYRLELLE